MPGCLRSPEAGSDHFLYYKVTEGEKLYARGRRGCILDKEHSMSKKAVGINIVLNAETVLDTEKAWLEQKSKAEERLSKVGRGLYGL